MTLRPGSGQADGTRILRTVGIPLIIGLVFLILVPKACQTALNKRKLRGAAPAAPAAQPSPDGALHIQSDAPAAKPVVFPAGLDAQRVQYLVEIDQHFTERAVVRVMKPGGEAGDLAAANALVRAGIFEQSGTGFVPAAGASLHVSDITEEPQDWRVPVGTRKFGRVTSVEDLHDGRARVTFTWQWEPNEAGRAIRSSFDLHEGRAELAGGGEHPWDLNAVAVDNDWR